MKPQHKTPGGCEPRGVRADRGPGTCRSDCQSGSHRREVRPRDPVPVGPGESGAGMRAVTKSDRSFYNFCIQVRMRLLFERGAASTFEHPGCIVIQADEGRSWWFGTINSTWSADLMSADGATCHDSVDTGIDAHEENPQIVADAIAQAISLKCQLRDYARTRRENICRFPQLHLDASPVPAGLKPRQGVEYGCGRADCELCYEPEGGR